MLTHPFVVLLLPLIAGILLCNYTGFPFELQRQKYAHSSDFTETHDQIRHRLIDRYRELGISGTELGTLSALTLGWRGDLDPDVKRSFRLSGASHILAVSGLHTGIIYMVILSLLTGFGFWKPLYEDKARRIANSVIVMALMIFYAFLTGLSPSVCRSVLMLCILQCAYMCYRRPNALNTIAAAAFLILALRPTDLFSVSFQLSFAAVIAIVYLTPLFNSLIPVPHSGWYAKPVRYVRDLVTVSIAAQIGTIPITLYYFHQTCNYFLLTNMVVIPLAFCITLLALATLTIGWIPCVGTILACPLKWLTWALNHYTSFIESLPGAYSIIQ